MKKILSIWTVFIVLCAAFFAPAIAEAPESAAERVFERIKEFWSRWGASRDEAADLSGPLTAVPISLPEGLDGSGPLRALAVADGDQRMLLVVARGEYTGQIPYLQNWATGEITPLCAHPDDAELWESRLYLTLGKDKQAAGEALLQKAGGDAFAAAMSIAGFRRCTASAGDIMLLDTSVGYLEIDASSGLTRFARGAWLTPNGNIVNWQIPQTEYAVIDAKSGEESPFAMQYDANKFIACALLPFSDGTAAAILRDIRMDREKPMQYALALNVHRGMAADIISLGGHKTLNGPDTVLYAQGENAGIAYSRMYLTRSGLIRFEADSGSAYALHWDGETLAQIPISDIADESGMLMWPEGNMLVPIGLSRDGKWAMFVDYEVGGLLLANVDTLETKFLLTPDEHAALTGDAFNSPYSPINLSLMKWNGSDMLFGTIGNCLQIVERTK